MIGAALVSEIWGWFIHTAFVFVVEMPLYVCSNSAWWVAECKFEVLAPLIKLARKMAEMDFSDG